MTEATAELDIKDREVYEEMKEYVTDFIAKRFPEGIPDARIHGIIIEIVLDAFHDGARYSQQLQTQESRIITEV